MVSLEWLDAPPMFVFGGDPPALEQGKTCPGCGDLCGWEAKYCAECGTQLGLPLPQMMEPTDD